MKRLARLAGWAALAAAAIFVAYELSILARLAWWRTNDPPATAFMEQRLERLREKKPQAKLRQQWVPYARISPSLKRAIVAAEDAKFADHEGFDWEAMQKAWEKNQKRGKVVAGGSTISQQLAKNLFLSGERTPWRKAQEAMITVMLESVMDKRRILEIYLNVIEWGDGVFGAEAAARHYFGTSAAALTPGAGRAPGGHGAQPALLRPQPLHALAREEDPDHPRAHGRGGSSLRRPGK